MEETITHAAGATTEAGLTRAQMEGLIRGAGREPFERDAFYERVVRDASGRVLRANRHDFAHAAIAAASAAPSERASGLDPRARVELGRQRRLRSVP